MSVLPFRSGTTQTPPQKGLIVYYSGAGNTDFIARKLQQKTGADIFRPETVKPSPKDNPARTRVPERELETGQLPALKKVPADLSTYDLILVGTPVWWYTVSTPAMSFWKQAELNNKKVAVFCTYESGPGNTFPISKNRLEKRWFPADSTFINHSRKVKTKPANHWTTGWKKCRYTRMPAINYFLFPLKSLA